MSLVIDASHLLRRNVYVSPTIDWTVYSVLFTRSFVKMITEFKDKHVIACWDKDGSTRRKILYGSYKKRPEIDMTTPEGRKKAQEERELEKAREWLHDAIPRMGFQSMLVEGIEADDIAYWFVTEKSHEGSMGPFETNWLVTEDRDWFQMIDEFWWVFRPIAKERVTYKDFIEKYDSRERFIYMKALLGDPSDNIPKCYGMGETKINYYTDRIMSNESIEDSSKLSWNLQEFISSGQFTKNIELIDFSLIGRGEKRKLHKEYDESLKRIKKEPGLMDWIKIAQDLNASELIDYGDKLDF